MTHITSKESVERLQGILDWVFEDNQKARILEPDGTYRRRKPLKGEEPARVQLGLFNEARGRADKLKSAPLALEPLTRTAKA